MKPLLFTLAAAMIACEALVWMVDNQIRAENLRRALRARKNRLRRLRLLGLR